MACWAAFLEKSMMKKILLPCLVVCILLLAACNTTATPGGGDSNPATTVHMDDSQFVPDIITIKKGDKLTLVDDVPVIHVIQNGRWDSNGTQRPGAEAGAPTVQIQFNGDDQQSVGPFTIAGTFHLYCTIHNDMNLTVIVK
jgi:plastocyanin